MRRERRVVLTSGEGLTTVNFGSPKGILSCYLLALLMYTGNSFLMMDGDKQLKVQKIDVHGQTSITQR